jgi:hypothetical protein
MAIKPGELFNREVTCGKHLVCHAIFGSFLGCGITLRHVVPCQHQRELEPALDCQKPECAQERVMIFVMPAIGGVK